jgi:hypothetical protein
MCSGGWEQYMTKIPVGKTINFAYSFTFGHLGAIIALIWLPTIAVALLSFVPQLLGMPTQAIFAPNVPADIRLLGLCASLISMVFSVMTYQAVAELALGLRQPGANFYFSLAPPIWRLLGTILLFILLLALFVIIFVVALVAAGAVAAAAGGKPAAAIAVALALPFALGFFWLVIFRIGFLIVPVTVAEGRIDLARGWTLTRGNFWRMLAVALAIWLPFLVLFGIGFVQSMGSDFSVLMATIKDTTAQADVARAALIQRHMPLLIGLNLLFTPFIMGLGVGASSFAYRALTPPVDVFA